MSMSIGCVGCGNMGGAILAGLAASSLDCTLYGHTRTAARMAPLEAAGVTRLDSAGELARKARYVVMAVKPYQVEALLAGMAPDFGPDTVVISVAAGISIARLQAAVGGRCPVVRCMPNTPALVGKGVFALCFDDKVPAAGKEDILRFFSQLGVCLELPESRFTAFSALIGAGPAYVFGMMQGLVQAGVTLGLGRKECRDMVAALFEGSAVMAARSDTPLMELRDQVCSPGGLTIAGVNVLDRAGLSGLLLIGYSGFFLFLLLESFQPGSFRGPDPGGVSLQDLFYFSYISLMTIGYGDITPVSWAARNATVLVSLSANIYSLVVIASIVGRTFASRPVQKAAKEPAPKEDS